MPKTQDTELIVHAQVNADIQRLHKLKESCADSAKQHFHLSRPARNQQLWLQLARLLVAARASGRGTEQQIISTFYTYNPSSYQARSTSPPTLAMSPILQQQLPFRSFLLPKHLPPIPEEPP